MPQDLPATVTAARDPRFVSPFSVWTTPEAVAAACTARTRAFHGVAGVTVLAGSGQAFIRWHGVVGARELEGSTFSPSQPMASA